MKKENKSMWKRLLYLSTYFESNVEAENLEDKLDVYKASIKFDDVLKDKTAAANPSNWSHQPKFTQNWQFSTFLISGKIWVKITDEHKFRFSVKLL